MKPISLTKDIFVTGLLDCIGDDPEVSINGVDEADDLKEFAISFFDNHKGIFLEKFLENTCAVEHDELKSLLKKSERLNLFKKNVEFVNLILHNDNVKKNISKKELLTLKEAQVVYDSCNAEGHVFRESKCPIKAVDHFDLYNGVPVKYSDGFKIKRNMNIPLAESVCFIVDKDDTVAAVGRLIEGDLEYRIVIDNTKDSINFENFKNVIKFSIIVCNINNEKSIYDYRNSQKIPAGIELYAISTKIRLCELEMSDKPLCIDFGTSNTTAGTYGLKAKDADSISCVEFEYTEDNKVKTSKMLPTMAYIKSCENENNVEFLFGYEAKAKVVECKYDTDATVYFELKRWMTELNVPEDIIEDENGNTLENYSRAKIIRAYLQYVIDESENYFKVKFNELHFSAPVKLKGAFIREIQKILPESYTVYASSKCLDEGIAIVYDYIENEIGETIDETMESSGEQKVEKKKVLILDCGGGTTDLVNCEYSYKTDIPDGDAALEVCAQFENGNPNFGGNNITYRILQLIKIKMVDSLYEDTVESNINKLMPNSDAAILDEVDNNAKNKVRPLTGRLYDAFENTYGKCEEYIPTRYADSEYNKSESKRNYFYLWQLAEKIKIEFYRQANLATYNLNQRIKVEQIDDFYLYRLDQNNDEIIKDAQIPEIEITNNEIKKIIYADIYAVLNDLFDNIDIDKFDKYKLSGQSCKVTLFQELLKEFITGRKLRETNMKSSNTDENLKLGCINGCIAFTKGVKRGVIVSEKAANRVKAPKLIYTVNVLTSCSTPVIEPGRPYGACRFKKDADELKFEVRNMQGDLARAQFEFRTNTRICGRELTMTDVEKAIKKHSEITEEDLDRLRSELEDEEFTDSKDGMVIFTTVSKDGYGFNIYQLYVKCDGKKNNYYFPEELDKKSEYVPRYENFESVTATFFNGHR